MVSRCDLHGEVVLLSPLVCHNGQTDIGKRFEWHSLEDGQMQGLGQYDLCLIKLVLDHRLQTM